MSEPERRCPVFALDVLLSALATVLAVAARRAVREALARRESLVPVY